MLSYRSLAFLGVALATSGTLANTSMDQHVTNWSDAHFQGATGDKVAADFKMFGNGWNTIPVFVGVMFAGPLLEDTIPVAGPIGEWGNRSIQAMLAAGPMELFFNRALGSSRPTADEGSKWRPFHDSHGVSGHAFMGAIPFLTAASMTDSVAAKVALFLLSFGTAWARVEQDVHYLSEVVMGWSLAWIGVDAVNRTKNGDDDTFFVSPVMLSGNIPGIQLVYRF